VGHSSKNSDMYVGVARFESRPGHILHLLRFCRFLIPVNTRVVHVY
jgi:hypothetical protein